MATQAKLAEPEAVSTMAFARHLLNGATPPCDSRITALDKRLAEIDRISARAREILDRTQRIVDRVYPPLGRLSANPMKDGPADLIARAQYRGQAEWFASEVRRRITAKVDARNAAKPALRVVQS